MFDAVDDEPSTDTHDSNDYANNYRRRKKKKVGEVDGEMDKNEL